MPGLHELAVGSAKATFLLHGKVPPTWLLEIAGRFVLIRTEWDSERDKDMASALLRGFMATLGVQRYAFVSEVYAAHYTAGVRDDRLPSERPRSERDELLVIGSETATDLLMSQFLITPRPKPAFPILGPRIDMAEDRQDFTGRMFGMLKPAAETEALAKKMRGHLESVLGERLKAGK